MGPRPLFGPDDFRLTLRVSRWRFEQILQHLSSTDSFYQSKRTDAVGRKMGCCRVEAKIIIALKSLAFGVTPECFCGYFHLSSALARQCFDKIMNLFPRLFLEEYIRTPTQLDIRSNLNLHRYNYEVNGMIENVDYMHIGWKNCPKSLKGSFKDKEDAPTVALVAGYDHNLFLWHLIFGYPGTLNDKLSLLLNMMTDGSLHKLEQSVVQFNRDLSCYFEQGFISWGG